MQCMLFTSTYEKGNSRGMENGFLYNLQLLNISQMSCLSLCMKRHLLPSKDTVASGTLSPMSPNCARRSSEQQCPATWSSKKSLEVKSLCKKLIHTFFVAVGPQRG